MAVLPQAQWEQQYPYHTISYQEYVKQVTAQNGGTQVVAQQQPSQSAPPNSTFNNEAPISAEGYAYHYGNNPTIPYSTYVSNWYKNTGKTPPTTSASPQAAQSNLPTFSVWYNQQRQSNPGITVADAQAQYAKLSQASANPPANQQTVTYNPSPVNMQGGDPGNTGTQVNQSQGATYNAGSTTPTNQTVNGQSVSGVANNDKALQTLLASPAYQGLPEDQKAMLRMVVQNWDVNQELNMTNVLKEFDNIKNSTIDPYFAEQVSTFTKNIQNQNQQLQQSRAQELEVQGLNQQNAIKDSRAGLEASGMTFSGEANRQLGSQSAYVPFAGQPEGLVNTSNRIMASSSLANYNKNMQSLGLAAEQGLGNQLGGLVPGYNPLGISTGSIQENKTKLLGSTLGSLAGQNAQNVAYKQPYDFSSFQNIFK